MFDAKISFTARMWLYQGKGSWCFVTLPKEDADHIKAMNGGKRRGWGAVRIKARIGGSEWLTSIFPDSKSGSYLLPVKADIRKSENIEPGDEVSVELSLMV